MTQIVVVDVETTGMGEDADVCQIGDCAVDPIREIIFGPAQKLLRPAVPIPPEAMAVHHITNEMVADAPPAAAFLKAYNEGKESVTLCAHNAEFEKRFLGTPETKWICTLKGARRIWPNAPSHKNQALRYWLGHPLDPEKASPPHHAGPDSYVTAWHLLELLKHATIEELIQWTTEPSLLAKFHFGKHAGVPLGEVPSDYLRWMTRQEGMDPDAIYTARTELERRG